MKTHLWPLAAILSLFLAITGCDSGPTREERISAELNEAKQKWFDQFHPVGTAKSITLHQLEPIQGRNGTQVSARFTIYWEGPLTKDGFTKVKAVYDPESQRWVKAEILETNGVTNKQTIEGIGDFIQGFIQGYQQSQ